MRLKQVVSVLAVLSLLVVPAAGAHESVLTEPGRAVGHWLSSPLSLPSDFTSFFVGWFTASNNATEVSTKQLIFDEVSALLLEQQSTTKNIEKLRSVQQQVRNNTERIERYAGDVADTVGPGGRSVDSFGSVVSKGTTNLLNLPSYHPFNPERWRLKVDGDRKLEMYNDFSVYEKGVDAHFLRPGGGETVVLESAESPPYVVHYELWGSWSVAVNRSLQEGDTVRFGMYNGENGYYVEKNGSMDRKEVALVVERNGSVTQRRKATLVRPLTNFTRFELRTNWYNAGEQTWIQTVTNLSASNKQKNVVIGHTAPEGSRLQGPETPTLPTRYQVTRGTGNAAIRLDAGSTNILTAGDVSMIARVKTLQLEAELNGSGTWRPAAALRISPDREYIRASMTALDVAETEANTDFTAVAQQHAPSKVLQQNGSRLTSDVWSRPPEHSSSNSIVQQSNAVFKAANETGHPVWRTDDVGGFQIGWGSLYTTGNKGAAASAAQQGLKRPMYDSDVTVIWVKAEDEGNPTFPSNVTLETVIEMGY